MNLYRELSRGILDIDAELSLAVKQSLHLLSSLASPMASSCLTLIPTKRSQNKYGGPRGKLHVKSCDVRWMWDDRVGISLFCVLM